jgi:hypothetical protein
MPARRKGRKRAGGSGPSTVRITKGRVAIKVGGFPGTQKLAPSALIRKIAKKHIKKAASLLLKGTKGKTTRRKGRKGRKGRKKKAGGAKKRVRRSKRRK